MSKRLTPEQIYRAAISHGLEPAALRAVIAVESGGSGFLPDGRCKVLFERHHMWKRLQARGLDPGPLAAARPDLCGTSWKPKLWPYGSQAKQWDRIAAVIRFGDSVDRQESYAKAAYEATSWGLFQLMGFNYEAAGFPNVLAFKQAHEESEAQQLAAILRWMGGNGLLGRLAKRDWIRFTAAYNGPGQVPVYSARLMAAYARERRRK